MDRKEFLLRHVDKTQPGLEIAPSFRPIAAKREGYQVDILDHASREELQKKYQSHAVDTNAIEEVDFISRGEPYSQLTGKTKHYRWIIASHVIEHTPDLIGFLNECDAVLKDDGVLSLAIPDKRWCFDHFRPVTGLGKVIDQHFQKPVNHTPGCLAEYCLNVVKKDGDLAWNQGQPGEFHLCHSVEDAARHMKLARETDQYVDVHAWCFVPHSFRLLIHDLHALGLIPFREVEYSPTLGSEFFITLSRTGRGVDLSRLEILETIEKELRAVHKSPWMRYTKTWRQGWLGNIWRKITKRAA